MASLQSEPEDGHNTASAVRLRLLDTLIVLLCVMMVVLIGLEIASHGSRHDAGAIAAMAASLAAISATRSQIGRGGPALDPAIRARRKRLVAIALLVAIAGAIAGVAAVLVFH